jgi:hypothetical protein
MPVDTTRKPSSPARKTAPAAKPAPLPPPSRETELTGYLQVGSLVCVMKGWYADAGALSVHGPAFVHELADMAEHDEKVAKIVDYFVTAGPYSKLLAAALPLILQFGVNHGRISADAAGSGGIVPPETLEARVKADIARIQAEAIREAREAQAELDKVKAELNGQA